MLRRYHIELLCDYPEWWRYNVYIMAVGFDAEGGAGSFNNLVDKVREVGCDVRGSASQNGPASMGPPAGWAAGKRRIALTTGPCALVEIYVYVVANTFPATDVIGAWPPFPATLRVTADGMPVDLTTWDVNQWGGLTVVAHRVGS